MQSELLSFLSTWRNCRMPLNPSSCRVPAGPSGANLDWPCSVTPMSTVHLPSPWCQPLPRAHAPPLSRFDPLSRRWPASQQNSHQTGLLSHARCTGTSYARPASGSDDAALAPGVQRPGASDDAAASRQDGQPSARSTLEWATATVIENRSASQSCVSWSYSRWFTN